MRHNAYWRKGDFGSLAHGPMLVKAASAQVTIGRDMKTSRVRFRSLLLLSLIAAATIGCESRPSPAPVSRDQAGGTRHPRRERMQGQPGDFDYYVLALSWSPEFCHSHLSAAECTSG